MFAAAGLGFMKTEIEPTIQDNLTGWRWSFIDEQNYTFDPEKIEIINNEIKLKQDQSSGAISNNYPFCYGCLPNPAVGFLVDADNNIKFQISKDNLNWYYWNNSEWRNAQNLDQSNMPQEINQHIIDFWPRSLNQFYFKAILNSPEDKLRSVNITCDQSTMDKIKLYPESL